jgi:hypothetical protein
MALTRQGRRGRAQCDPVVVTTSRVTQIVMRISWGSGGLSTTWWHKFGPGARGHFVPGDVAVTADDEAGRAARDVPITVAIGIGGGS